MTRDRFALLALLSAAVVVLFTFAVRTLSGLWLTLAVLGVLAAAGAASVALRLVPRPAGSGTPDLLVGSAAMLVTVVALWALGLLG